MPFTAPGPLSSVLQEISNPNLASGAEVAPVPGLSGRADITTYSAFPHLPSLIKEVVVLGANAVLDANIEVTGNLQVDGVLSANSTGTQSASALNISPGPLVVAGATGAFGGLVSVVQEQTPISNPGVGLTVQSSTDYALGAEVSGDTSYRFAITGAGGLNWGSGSGTIDTRLSRTGVSALTLTAGISSNPPQFTVVSSVTTANPLFQAVNSLGGDLAYGVMLASDTIQRWTMNGAGLMLWGPGGTVAQDTQLSRSGAGVLTVQPATGAGGLRVSGSNSASAVFGVANAQSAPSIPSLTVVAAAAADNALGISVSGDAGSRFASDSNGKLQWSQGGTFAADTDLYRSGTGTLTTDGVLTVGGALSVAGAAAAKAGLAVTGALTVSTTTALSGQLTVNGAPVSSPVGPGTATAETFPRAFANTATTTLGTQQVYVTAIDLPKGLVVNGCAFCTKSTGTGGATITHAWYVLMDPGTGSGPVVRAVTADQATSTTFLASVNTLYPLPFAAPYTTPSAGLYYLGVMVECGTMPNLASPGLPAAGLTSALPILAGLSSSAQTVPPSTGGTLSAISAGGGFLMYGYTD